MSFLFSPFRLRDLVLDNRIVVAPMCQYAATGGSPADWHGMHLGNMAISGAGLMICEATGVSADGRITPDCTGLYSDENEAAFRRQVEFCRSIAPIKIGIQINHSGRKGSTRAPWLDGGPLTEEEGAWQPMAPSAVPYLDDWAPPRAMDAADLEQVKADFVQAARRASGIGFDLLELHVAHGYLLHQFLSPVTNRRTDGYGGSLDNRMRFPLEVFEAVREVFPSDRPLIIRLSATDWIDGAWDVRQSVIFAQQLKALGCDMLHVTSGGLAQHQAITTGPGYQVEFAHTIRQEAGIPTMAVGEIVEPIQAETIIRTGQADLVSLARGMLWDPRWVWKAAVALDAELTLPAPYARSNPKLRAKPFILRS